MTETLGQRIRRLRVAKGWTPRRLAAAVGCTVQTIRAWERERCPGELQREMLAPALGVSMDFLWTGEDR